MVQFNRQSKGDRVLQPDYAWYFEHEDATVNDEIYEGGTIAEAEVDRPDDFVDLCIVMYPDGIAYPDRRSYAYVVYGKLPVYFENHFGNPTRKIPARFHQHLKEWLKTRRGKKWMAAWEKAAEGEE